MRAVKRILAEQVRAVFNDTDKGERPVERHDDGLFEPGSIAWRVHGDVTTMMVGGVSALLLQMLHPKVLAGVWDFSNFRHDMHGRLRRTARFIALTTYGSCRQAEGAIAHVRRIHAEVQGTMPGGDSYSAQDPRLLTWVHATESISFLNAWIRYAEPLMRSADQDRYFAEVAVVARGLGAKDIPETRSGTVRFIQAMRAELRADERTREVAGLILRNAGRNVDAVPLELVRRAAIDLLPGWARRLHGLRASTLTRPLVATGTLALAQTLRWAFR
jgi:uncharacterized protein (DUF2236 family)